MAQEMYVPSCSERITLQSGQRGESTPYKTEGAMAQIQPRQDFADDKVSQFNSWEKISSTKIGRRVCGFSVSVASILILSTGQSQHVSVH